MSRDITAPAAAYALNAEIKTIFLIELKLTAATEYYTTDNQDVIYGGNTYSAAPSCSVSGVDRDLENNIPTCSLNIGNVDLSGAAIIANEIRGAKVVISKYGDDQYVYPYFSGRIESYSLNEQWLVLQLQGNLSVMQMQVPVRTFAAKCPWVFKGAECGYTGTLATCAKSYGDCKTRNRLKYFGGFNSDE